MVRKKENKKRNLNIVKRSLDVSFSEAARNYGISPQRANQICVATISKLLKPYKIPRNAVLSKYDMMRHRGRILSAVNIELESL